MNAKTTKALLAGAVLGLALAAVQPVNAADKPWDNGKLQVSDNGRFLVHENGEPFFWLGETAWLLTSRLQREEIDFYLKDRAKKGYNVIQCSIFHYWPQFNVYGECATPNGYDFRKIDQPGRYTYWDHVDYAVDQMARYGMYMAIVCCWGSEIVKGGHMTADEARKYGTFLGNRYKDKPNIIWVIGGDVSPDRAPGHREIWEALATSIKAVDKNHLMTYHTDGRHSSAEQIHEASWLDFDTFQSGHRRYGQNFGQTEDYPIEHGTEEDNWQYVERAYRQTPAKPVLDAEPSYEGIPHGLRSGDEPYWQPCDIRRYAYWSVFAGSCGHTYGDNAVMQFYIPSIVPSFFPLLPWYEAVKEPASGQMIYLKQLMTAFPFTQGGPAQEVIQGEVGEKYERLLATKGPDYLMVYDYSGRELSVDLSAVEGKPKKLFWFRPEDGSVRFVGLFDGVCRFKPEGQHTPGNDWVLVAYDSQKNYLETATGLSGVAEAKAAASQAVSDQANQTKAAGWVASLNLGDAGKEARVTAVIATHLNAVRDYHNQHAGDIPDGAIDPRTGRKLSGIERQVLADSSIPGSVRQALLDGLNADLTPEQVEAILDKYTVGKVEFTMKAYREIVPDMTPEDEAFLYQNLKEARLRAVDFKNMKEISQIFEIYKTINENHFTETGRDWHTMYKEYTNRLKAEKAAKAAASN